MKLDYVPLRQVYDRFNKRHGVELGKFVSIGKKYSLVQFAYRTMPEPVAEDDIDLTGQAEDRRKIVGDRFNHLSFVMDKYGEVFLVLMQSQNLASQRIVVLTDQNSHIVVRLSDELKEISR